MLKNKVKQSNCSFFINKLITLDFKKPKIYVKHLSKPKMTKRMRDESVDNVFSFINGDDSLIDETMEFFRKSNLDDCVLRQLEVLYYAAYIDNNVEVPYFPWEVYAQVSEPLLDRMLTDGTISDYTYIKYKDKDKVNIDGKTNSQISGKKRVRRVGTTC